VDLAAYRIVQEALTNAVKHTAGGTVSVRVEYLPGALVLTVDSRGPAGAGPVVPGAGVGLVGMRSGRRC
jgi:signal transduction histidine kinase